MALLVQQVQKQHCFVELMPSPFDCPGYAAGLRCISVPQVGGVAALQVARVLAYLHNSNPQILHRDLKAENILLTVPGRAGDVRVMDFGLTKLRRALSSL
jgi:serine/threonine protein kinase